jgi:ketosteroid isomerase-like protein
MSKEIVAQFFAAGERDDIEAAVACFTDDAKWIAAEGDEPGTTYGVEEIPAVLAKLIGVRKEFEGKGISVDYGELVEAGDRVYLEISITSAGGQTLARSVDIFTIRDGLIAVKDVYSKG